MAPDADNTVGSNGGNWNEKSVRKRHCVIPDGENDATHDMMHKDMKAVERITDLAKQRKDSVLPEQLPACK